ncbi:hypothetical protein BGZ82_002168 [Podila clonocystis]|nr:hypothetical protein BGZ82_002168 [Podila clonocystis]
MSDDNAKKLAALNLNPNAGSFTPRVAAREFVPSWMPKAAPAPAPAPPPLSLSLLFAHPFATEPWFTNALSQGQAEFRSAFRTTREGLSALLGKIQDHPVFSNNTICPQAHPSVQLGVALARLGVSKSEASVGKLHSHFEIGAGTITLYIPTVSKRPYGT